MAELVVHRLELVEVEQQHRDVLAVALGAAQRLVERALQAAAVAEAGERVGLGLLAQRVRVRDAFERTGEVLQHAVHRVLVGRRRRRPTAAAR